MKRLLAWIGVVLVWVIVLWGCFVVAFGCADFYTVKFGGAAPGELVMGDPAPTVGQATDEILVGIGMIAFALFCRWRIRERQKAQGVPA